MFFFLAEYKTWNNENLKQLVCSALSLWDTSYLVPFPNRLIKRSLMISYILFTRPQETIKLHATWKFLANLGIVSYGNAIAAVGTGKA